MFHQFLAILFCEGCKDTNAAVNNLSLHKSLVCALRVSTDWVQCMFSDYKAKLENVIS